MALVVGLVLLIAGWFAGRERRGPGALARAGLRPEREVVEAVGGRRGDPVRHAGPRSLDPLLGVLTLGAGWGAFHDRALDGALLADLAPERVVLTGRPRPTPRSRRSAGPPSPRCGGSSGRKGPRRPLPDLGQRERRGAWGSPRRPRPTEGTLRVPDDEGFAEALRDKGIPAQLQLQTLRRLGPSSSAFIRATQAVRSIVGHLDRERVPRKEAGLLLGLLLGDDLRSTPGSSGTSGRPG